MAIATTGGSGTTSANINSTVQQTSLFTTPATANAIFIISVTISGNKSSPGNSSPVEFQKIIAGPSTAISIPVMTSTNVTIHFSWHWVGIVIT